MYFSVAISFIVAFTGFIQEDYSHLSCYNRKTSL